MDALRWRHRCAAGIDVREVRRRYRGKTPGTPLGGFLPADEPRVAGTARAIEDVGLLAEEAGKTPGALATLRGLHFHRALSEADPRRGARRPRCRRCWEASRRRSSPPAAR